MSDNKKPFSWVDEVETQMRAELLGKGPAAEARPVANVPGEQTTGYAAVPHSAPSGARMNEPSKADMERAARILESIARQECPHCGSSMLEEIGRSVYCGDCGARLYLGKCFPPLRGVATGEEPGT